ncbi:hypothetical protein [Streptomyces cylindrosporus]|uniref:Uncharacterized protein n=1 Tax=Streptomyces cylindrosporus TaxID=2927583 RepID=A0ABS9YJS2_9ACTN|nr:hypothetical protein [Streptomyces cylindrosporus]MCI3277473.1 hypothetical protein [Streptomyces cylindrosporus]
MSAAAKEFQADATTRSLLHQRLYTLFGRRVSEVRITRVTWPEGHRWVAMVLGPGDKEVPPVRGSGLHVQAALVLKEAFPQANWGRGQNYDVTTGVLREHVVRQPASARKARNT